MGRRGVRSAELTRRVPGAILGSHRGQCPSPGDDAGGPGTALAHARPSPPGDRHPPCLAYLCSSWQQRTRHPRVPAAALRVRRSKHRNNPQGPFHTKPRPASRPHWLAPDTGFKSIGQLSCPFPNFLTTAVLCQSNESPAPLPPTVIPSPQSLVEEPPWRRSPVEIEGAELFPTERPEAQAPPGGRPAGAGTAS